MLANIIQIGDSKGIRIPKLILQQCNFSNQVEMKIERKKLIIESVKKEARSGWREAFAKNNKVKKSEKIMDFSNKFDEEEWKW